MGWVGLGDEGLSPGTCKRECFVNCMCSAPAGRGRKQCTAGWTTAPSPHVQVCPSLVQRGRGFLPVLFIEAALGPKTALARCSCSRFDD